MHRSRCSIDQDAPRSRILIEVHLPRLSRLTRLHDARRLSHVCCVSCVSVSTCPRGGYSRSYLRPYSRELAISWKIASEKLAISRKAFFLHHLPNGVRVWWGLPWHVSDVSWGMSQMSPQVYPKMSPEVYGCVIHEWHSIRHSIRHSMSWTTEHSWMTN